MQEGGDGRKFHLGCFSECCMVVVVERKELTGHDIQIKFFEKIH